MIPKRMKTEPELIGDQRKRGSLVDQLSKHGWK